MKYFLLDKKFVPESSFFGKRICSSIIPYIEDVYMQCRDYADMEFGWYDMYTDTKYPMPMAFDNIIVRNVTKEVKRNFDHLGENAIDVMYHVELQIGNSIVKYDIHADEINNYQRTKGNESALDALEDFFINVIPFMNYVISKRKKELTEVFIFVLGVALRRRDGVKTIVNGQCPPLYIPLKDYDNIIVRSNYTYTYRVGRDDMETWTTSIQWDAKDFMRTLFLKLVVKRKATEERAEFFSNIRANSITYGYERDNYVYGPQEKNRESILCNKYITDLMPNYYHKFVEQFIELYKEYVTN